MLGHSLENAYFQYVAIAYTQVKQKSENWQLNLSFLCLPILLLKLRVCSKKFGRIRSLLISEEIEISVNRDVRTCQKNFQGVNAQRHSVIDLRLFREVLNVKITKKRLQFSLVLRRFV